ncbi:MAG: mucoidy inhibitor MuiA family protein [Alphaproteobacteria bacterium]|nr:mucoidy inhibitor MuiA family protein [Alphaproteobacteria bacterium]
MRILPFSLIVFFLSFPVFAKDIDVESTITAATAYNDRAAVTRRGAVEVPAGAHNLVLKGLPVSLYPDSLRAEGSSSATVSFGAITHKLENFVDLVVPKEQELTDQLETLHDQRKLLDVEKSALEVGKDFIRNLGKQAGLRADEEIAKLELSPESWSAAADGLSSKMLETLRAQHMLDLKMRETDETIRKVQNELNQLRTGRRQSYVVTIPFEADRATSLTVEVSYQLPGVSWWPIYDARYDSNSGDLELIQYGAVSQHTGEEWEDIELTLSTARPNLGTALPDLLTKWVDIFDNQYKAEKRMQVLGGAAVSNMAAAPAMDMAYESDAIMAEEGFAMRKEVAFQAAQIETDGLVAEYKITGPADVASDGTQAKLLIGSFETDSKSITQIKPQYSTDAYHVVKATLKGEAPILPGQVSLFRNNAYIGQGYFPMLRPGDEQELSFGIDDNVVVKRNVLFDESSESGLISKESVVEKHFVTEIQNLHKKDIEIAVLESVPVSRNEKIRVEILQTKTTGGYKSDMNDIKGVLEWQKTLKPKEETKVNLGWKVMWPKGENISGL